MQITNNQVSSYSYGANSTTQTNSSNTANSFDSYLSNTNEKTTTPNNQTSKVVAFIDKYNGFSSLSPTDEKIFRDILSDDKFTMQEIQSLTYEQVQKIGDFLTPTYVGNIPDNEFADFMSTVPIVKVTDSKIGSMLQAVKMTDNEEFNKALFETVQTIDNQIERDGFLGEVSNSLGWNDKTTLIPERDVPELRKDSTKENWEIKDYKSFIQTMLTKYKKIYESPAIQSSPESLERYEKLLKSLSTLGKNHEEVISKTKYA